MSSIQFLIKPVSSSCNLNCKYCFYLDESEKRSIKSYGKMDYSTAEAIIDRAMSDPAQEIYFVFQGGEPTLAGIDFYEHFCSYALQQNVGNKKINFSIQTNGCYQYGAEWAELFAKYDFLVGVSYDGLREIQNYLRPSAADEETAKDVLKNISLLNSSGVRFNIVTVVTPLVAEKIMQIYHRYRKNGWNYLQFIPCLPKLGERESIFTLKGKSWLEYSYHIFELWCNENIARLKKGLPMSCSVRHLDDYLSSVLSNGVCTCGALGYCSVQNVIEADGSVFPCDFYALDGLCMGNIRDASLSQLAKSDAAVKFLSEKPRMTECDSCEFNKVCALRCKRYTYNGISLYYPYCKEYYGHTLGKIKKMAQYLKGNL